jgi:uncharacterized membrane protein
MLATAGLRLTKRKGKKMRVRILTVLSVVLLLSVGVATAAAAPKQKFPASQQLCGSYGGAFSTHANSSFFAPFYKKQGVLWTCNSYSGGSTASQAFVQSCAADGGQATSTLDSGFATCWKNSPL